MENSGAVFEIKGLRQKWKDVGEAITQAAPVEERFELSVVVDAETRTLQAELYAPGIIYIFTPRPLKWDEYFSTDIASVRLANTALHEKVTQALEMPVRDLLRDDSADASEADSVLEVAQQLAPSEKHRLTQAASEDRFDSMITHLHRITSTLESMSSRMNAVETQLSVVATQPSGVARQPTVPLVEDTTHAAQEQDLFPDFPVVDVAAWKVLLSKATPLERRAILQDGLMEDPSGSTDGLLLSDLFTDLLGLVDGLVLANWTPLGSSKFLRMVQRLAAKIFFLSSRALRGSSGRMLDYLSFLRDKNVFAAPSTFRDKTSDFVKEHKKPDVSRAKCHGCGKTGHYQRFCPEKSLAASKKGKEKPQTPRTP
eukprot:gene4731-biopygen3227